MSVFCSSFPVPPPLQEILQVKVLRFKNVVQMYQVHSLQVFYCIIREWEKWIPPWDKRLSSIVLCRYEKTQAMDFLSNSGAQKFRNPSCACLHGKSATSEWPFLLFLFSLLNLSTDAMLLQCRHWQLQRLTAFICPQNRQWRNSSNESWLSQPHQGP